MHKGHCLCGAVTWSHPGGKTRNLNCHCDECRRGVSGAFSAVMGVPSEGLTIEGPWADYKYTADSSRAFCTVCGTRIWFRSEIWSDEAFLNVGALDDPDKMMPDQHVMTRDSVPWVNVDDGIAVSEGFQLDPDDAPVSTLLSSGEEAGLSGRCLCGDVTWQTESEPLWSGHCHCDSCRRATGAPFTSFFGVPRDHVTWSGEMTTYLSSNGKVARRFCRRCGTHMSYQYEGWPDETHLYATSLTDAGRFHPDAHFHFAEKLPWVALADDLPRYPGSADTTEPLA